MFRKTLVSTALLSFFVSLHVQAAPLIRTPHATVELVTEREAASPGVTQWIGLHFKPQPGWHVYWKNPGDSGLPPRVEFSTSLGGSSFSALEFPTPVRMPYGPLMNYGYEGEVLYLAKWALPAEAPIGESVTLVADARWLICKEECVPGKAELKLQLPIETKQRFDSSVGTHGREFSESIASLPIHPPTKVGVELKADALELTYKGTVSKADLAKVHFFPESEVGVAPTSKQTVSAIPNGVRVSIPRDPSKAKQASDIRGILKLRDWRSVRVGMNGGASSEESALQGDAPLKPEKNALTSSGGAFFSSLSSGIASGEGGYAALGVMLFFAFVGGLILNLMPCILPVLSIKVMEIASQAGIKTREIRKHGLVFTVGVLASFWVLAAVLLILRSGGTTLGWGFQLQNPYFIALLALLFFAMAMNLFGFFEVGTRMMGMGSGLARKDGYAGSFFTGVLTTVAATPCSAPFMGTALGFALTRSAWESLLVLSFLGLGLAFPYLVFSFLPNAAALLPKPGMWMKTLKELLGFPLLATSIWLVGVLGNQTGIPGVVSVLAVVVLAIGAIWLFRQKAGLPVFKSLRWISIIACVFGAIALFSGLGEKQRSRVQAMAQARLQGTGASSPLAHAPWREWSPVALQEALSAKKTVVVNFTADWCVTCKVNEKLVFERESVKTALAGENVVALLADWTNGDPAMTEAMMAVGRNSVPVYLLYKNGSPTPKILPQVLSVNGFLSEIQNHL